MKIAILGAGNVGATLARGLRAAGHDVVLGVRDPDDPKHALLTTDGLRLAGHAVAVAHADVVLLATPWAAVQPLLTSLGDLGGRVLVDATNPIGPGFALTHGHTDSGGEQVQRWAVNARVVKTFNTTGVENMARPVYPAGPAFMPVAGDDAQACDVAMSLARDLGFETVRLGTLDKARLLEPMAMVWTTLAMSGGAGRHFAFGLMRRE